MAKFSKGKSADIKAGMNVMHVKTIVKRLPKSETDRPGNINKNSLTQCNKLIVIDLVVQRAS